MPEIDLPTVIFALVALFVAWKLRSVLGMRQDSERPGESYGPLAPRSRPSQRACRAAGRGALRADFAGSRGSLEGRRRARSCGLERPRRHCRRGSQLFAARLSGRRSRRLRHGRPCFRRWRFRRPQKPDVARGLRQFRERDPRPRRRRTHNVDHGRLDRQRVRLSALGSSARPRNFSVRFSAKLASVTRDAQGEVVDGSPDTVVEHIDLWTFARDVRSRDPNWQLTATESER